MRRWRSSSRQWLVEFRGKPVKSLKRSWRDARDGAGLSADLVPHILRHTAITWAMQGGAQLADVSAVFGVTIAELERTYYHHHPDHGDGVFEAVDRKR